MIKKHKDIERQKVTFSVLQSMTHSEKVHKGQMCQNYIENDATAGRTSKYKVSERVRYSKLNLCNTMRMTLFFRKKVLKTVPRLVLPGFYSDVLSRRTEDHVI